MDTRAELRRMLDFLGPYNVSEATMDCVMSHREGRFKRIHP